MDDTQFVFVRVGVLFSNLMKAYDLKLIKTSHNSGDLAEEQSPKRHMLLTGSSRNLKMCIVRDFAEIKNRFVIQR